MGVKNEKAIRFNELCKLVESFGGEIRPGKGSERVVFRIVDGVAYRFTLPKSTANSKFDAHVVYYLKKALKIKE